MQSGLPANKDGSDHIVMPGIKVTGKLILYKGKPEIEVTDTTVVHSVIFMLREPPQRVKPGFKFSKNGAVRRIIDSLHH